MPAVPLLTAKLFPPPYRAGMVARPRLAQRVDESLRAGRKLTLVCAPAGSGKTTLVVEWLERFKETAGGPGRRFGWLALERTDNELPVFLRYLIAAFQAVDGTVGATTQAVLESGRLPPLESLLLPLLNDLYSLPAPFVLVLDDYHVINDPAVHEVVTFLIERQPEGMHTIITTRQDPLLPLARWRARGQLTDIRLGDLRFKEGEAAEFLSHTMGLDLAAEDIAALETRTEGWIAGLQMAALSLQQSGPDGEGATAAEFIETFTGDDRFIVDYLVDEVLSRQPREVEAFLLKTAVLERLGGGICEAVVGRRSTSDGVMSDEVMSKEGERVLPDYSLTSHSSTSNLLAALYHANLFLIPLDNRGEWYRYHHLFAELLRYRLEQTYGKAYAAELRRRASLWCNENGFPDQAVMYAQAARDWALCGEIIMQHSPALIRQGEIVTLLRWVQAMPDSAVRSNPRLCREYGYALTHSGQLKQGMVYLNLAAHGLEESPSLLGGAMVYASHNALFRADFEEEITLAQRGLELLAADDAWMRGIAALSLGMGRLHTGQPQAAEEAFHQAYQEGRQADSPRTCIYALTQLGRVRVLGGDFAGAEEYFQRAVQHRNGGRAFAGHDMPLFDLAMLKYEQNDLDRALECVEQGLEANRRSGSMEMLAYGRRLAARIHQVQGRPVDARQYLRLAVQLANEFDLSPLTLSLNAALEVEMALWDGDLRRAEQAAPRVTNSLGVYPFMFYPETARVHLLIVQGRRAEAGELLQPVLAQVEQPGWEYARLQVRALQALAAENSQQAQGCLREALALARAAGAVRVFVDLGEGMRSLIRDCSARAENSHEKGDLLAWLPLFPAVMAPEAGRTDTAPGLIENLSAREIEVLRLLAQGLSNAEIAQRLYLSTNTLKAHTQNIYGKLDAHTRVQAVNRARELGII